MLIKAKLWIAETFREDSQPDMQTIRRLVEEGRLDGRIIGSTVFIETELGVAATFTPKKPALKKPKYSIL